MSELKEKLKKINLAKNHSIPLNEADTSEVNDLSSTGCHKTKLQEDLEESKAENDDNIRNCMSNSFLFFPNLKKKTILIRLIYSMQFRC